jgi:hypothetical protein
MKSEKIQPRHIQVTTIAEERVHKWCLFADCRAFIIQAKKDRSRQRIIEVE